MRKILIILSIFFTLISIIFTVFPLGTIALLPIVVGLLISFLAFQKSSTEQRKILRILIAIIAISMLVVVAKLVLIKDKVASDKQFEIKKEESKKEDIKELEGL